MYILIIAFYLSFLGLVLMLVLKRHEVVSGRPTVVSQFGERTDRIFHIFFAGVRRAISYADRRTLIVIAQWLAYHVLLRIRGVYVEVKHRTLMNPHGKKVIDAVRGRGEVKDHGASFYLRRISDK